jgi:hypothetical protein
VPEAQRFLSKEGRDGAPYVIEVGWHGSSVDARRFGAYAVVAPDGPLGWAVGRVLRVTPIPLKPDRRPLYVYAVLAADLEGEPMTLTRRMFIQAGRSPWEDAIHARVEVVPK